MSHFARPVMLLPALTLLAACPVLDNSGGPPPAGDPIAFEQLPFAESGFLCGVFDDSATLLADEAAVDAWLAGCAQEDPAEMRGLLLDELAALDEDQSLVVATVVLGGCAIDSEIRDVALDGDVLRPWILRSDVSYGRRDIACTAIIGEEIHLLRVDDDRSATAAELHVGTYNPELPGGPVTIQEG